MSTNTDTTRGVTRWLIREIMGVVLVGVTLFWPAGSLSWVWGWALVGIYAAWVAINAIVLIPRDPQLLIERATRRREGMKSWDVAIMGVIGLLTIGKHVVAGLDFRYTWTTLPIPLAVRVACLVLAILAYSLVNWAMASNAFFSAIVRIQDDRGHAVATGGPYRYVRHPGYVATIIFELVSPIMLGSLWALIAGGISALLFLVRTALEDRDLMSELDGYQEYAARVRYRLIPGIW
jgi:protein-S-isoprenylcysteine O-methyltransferase Ste14